MERDLCSWVWSWTTITLLTTEWKQTMSGQTTTTHVVLKVASVIPVVLGWHFHVDDGHKGEGSLFNPLFLKRYTKLIFDWTKINFWLFLTLIPGNLPNLSNCPCFHKYLLIICDSILLFRIVEFDFYKQKSYIFIDLFLLHYRTVFASSCSSSFQTLMLAIVQ